MQTVLITVHAAAATIALLSGLTAFRIRGLVGLHVAATLLMTATLAGALWAGRTSTPLPLEIVFLGLLALAAYMSYRAARAWRVRAAPRSRPGPAFIAALGFNSIGLVTGLLAVGVLRLGWGIPTVVVAAILPTLVGRIPLNRALRQAGATATQADPPAAEAPARPQGVSREGSPDRTDSSTRGGGRVAE